MTASRSSPEPPPGWACASRRRSQRWAPTSFLPGAGSTGSNRQPHRCGRPAVVPWSVPTDVAQPQACTDLVQAAMSELRAGRRPGQQRRCRHGGPGDDRVTGAVPRGDRRQSQRRVLGRSGVRADHETWQRDRQHQQRDRVSPRNHCRRRPTPRARQRWSGSPAIWLISGRRARESESMPSRPATSRPRWPRGIQRATSTSRWRESRCIARAISTRPPRRSCGLPGRAPDT